MIVLEFQQKVYKLTKLGQIAGQLREIQCLTFAQLLENGQFDKLTPQQLIVVFSCFTNVSVQSELKAILPKSNNTIIQNMVIKIKEMYDEYQQKELSNNNISIHFRHNYYYKLYIIRKKLPCSMLGTQNIIFIQIS